MANFDIDPVVMMQSNLRHETFIHKSPPGTPTQRKIADYLSASGVFAVCVVRDPDGVIGFELSNDIGSWEGAVIAALWTTDKTAATVVLTSATATVDAVPSEHAAVDAIVCSAERHSLRLFPHESVIKRAANAVARLDARMDATASRGGLKAFHAEYRRRRLDARKQGKRFMSFAMANRRLRRAIVNRLLHDDTATGDIITEVFA
jgi:hypothetical protein